MITHNIRLVNISDEGFSMPVYAVIVDDVFAGQFKLEGSQYEFFPNRYFLSFTSQMLSQISIRLMAIN